MIAVVEKRTGGKESPTVIKIGVTRAGEDALEQMAQKYGMKKQEIGGRIYEWFMAQDSIVQRAVLGLLEGLEVDAAARFMERLAKAGEDVDVDVVGELGKHAADATRQRGRDRPPGRAARR